VGVVGDTETDQLDDVRCFHVVDLASAVAAGTDDAGELEFGQVVADGGHAMAGLFGERADVTLALGEQPEQL
jgi:hypothetical protein